MSRYYFKLKPLIYANPIYNRAIIDITNLAFSFYFFKYIRKSIRVYTYIEILIKLHPTTLI